MKPISPTVYDIEWAFSIIFMRVDENIAGGRVQPGTRNDECLLLRHATRDAATHVPSEI